jgi:hypothetical protein
VHPKKIARLRAIPILSTRILSPGARDPILVVIAFDLPRENQAMMQKTIISHDETELDKTVRKKELPCIRHSRSLYRGQVVHGVVLMSMERKKKALKQRRNKETD